VSRGVLADCASSPARIFPVSLDHLLTLLQCDRDLRRRIRKVPGVPLMYVVKHKYQIERLPDGGASFN
jgi:U3 small nucleolar RNA-associated protein 24